MGGKFRLLLGLSGCGCFDSDNHSGMAGHRGVLGRFLTGEALIADHAPAHAERFCDENLANVIVFAHT